MRAIIFDLDGTLVDSVPDIRAAANHMLEGENLVPLSLETIRSFIGNGIPKLVERVMGRAGIAFNEEKHQALSGEFTRAYFDQPAALSQLYPNVRDTLDNLRAKGFSMGICTNKAHSITTRVLKELGLEKYFTSVIGADSLRPNKPDPAMLLAGIRELETSADEVIFVGDSEVDAATAEAANVRFVLFTSGYLQGSPEDINSAARFADFAQLPGLVNRIG